MVAAGAPDEAFQQIMFADRIVLNKVDLVPSAESLEVWLRIRSINARAAIVPCVRGKLDAKTLVDFGAFDLDKMGMEDDHGACGHDHDCAHDHDHHDHGHGHGHDEAACTDPSHDHSHGGHGKALHNPNVGSFSLLYPGMCVEEYPAMAVEEYPAMSVEEYPATLCRTVRSARPHCAVL